MEGEEGMGRESRHRPGHISLFFHPSASGGRRRRGAVPARVSRRSPPLICPVTGVRVVLPGLPIPSAFTLQHPQSRPSLLHPFHFFPLRSIDPAVLDSPLRPVAPPVLPVRNRPWLAPPFAPGCQTDWAYLYIHTHPHAVSVPYAGATSAQPRSGSSSSCQRG